MFQKLASRFEILPLQLILAFVENPISQFENHEIRIVDLGISLPSMCECLSDPQSHALLTNPPWKKLLSERIFFSVIFFSTSLNSIFLNIFMARENFSALFFFFYFFGKFQMWGNYIYSVWTLVLHACANLTRGSKKYIYMCGIMGANTSIRLYIYVLECARCIEFRVRLVSTRCTLQLCVRVSLCIVTVFFFFFLLSLFSFSFVEECCTAHKPVATSVSVSSTALTHSLSHICWRGEIFCAEKREIAWDVNMLRKKRVMYDCKFFFVAFGNAILCAASLNLQFLNGFFMFANPSKFYFFFFGKK